MADDLERAQEAMEHAHEAHVEHGDRRARDIAVLISVLAAALAIGEMQEKSAQNRYMAAHIQVSDDFAFYQAKTLRMALYQLHADLLAALPDAARPAMRQQIDAARATATRLDTEKDTGRQAILKQSERDKQAREHFSHRYELFEIVVGVLQIGIVLASVSVVTRLRAFAWAAGILGVGAIGAGILVWAGAI